MIEMKKYSLLLNIVAGLLLNIVAGLYHKNVGVSSGISSQSTGAISESAIIL
jgi:hypothetical protein